MIYHIITKQEWGEAQKSGFYEAGSLLKEGFIHACKKDQVTGVLGRYFIAQQDLLLLYIDEQKVSAPIKYEVALPVNEEFPHIYGRLNINAVVLVKSIL